MEKEFKTILLKLIEYVVLKEALTFQEANIPDIKITYKHFKDDNKDA